MKRLFLALAIALGTSQAHASDSRMTWEGPIDSAFLGAFEAQKDTIKDLYLESHGGMYLVGIQVAQEVRALGIRTHVTTFCDSSCAIIYQGGVRRFAAKSATFTHHSPSLNYNAIATYIWLCAGTYKVDSCESRFKAMTARNWDLFHEWVGVMVSLGAPVDFESLVRSQGIGEPWGRRGNMTELGDFTLTAEQAAHFGLVTDLQ